MGSMGQNLHKDWAQARVIKHRTQKRNNCCYMFVLHFPVIQTLYFENESFFPLISPLILSAVGAHGWAYVYFGASEIDIRPI